MNTEERQRQVAFHEREAARLQGEVQSGNLRLLGQYAYALANKRASELGVNLPCGADDVPDGWGDLEHVETPAVPEPQAQVNVAYLEYLTARKATLETAIRSACYYLSISESKRALELLNQSLTQ